MTVTFVFIVILIGLIIKAEKQYGKIESAKINYTHIGLMIFTILITGLSLTVLLEFALNFKETLKTVYIQNGILSPMMNTWLVIVNNILNVLVLFTVFRLAMRSEKARKLFVSIVPILFILGTIKTLNDLYVKGTSETSIEAAIILTVILIVALYAPLFFFYKNTNVKNDIFYNSQNNI